MEENWAEVRVKLADGAYDAAALQSFHFTFVLENEKWGVENKGNNRNNFQDDLKTFMLYIDKGNKLFQF